MTSLRGVDAEGDVLEAGRSCGRVVRLLLYSAGVGLLGLAGWRIARDLEPVTELARLEARENRGDFEGAERGYLRILEHSPRRGDAWRTLARLRARKGDWHGCAEALGAIPSWWPGKREALFMEGESWLRLNQARRAEAAWLACVKDDPFRPLPPEYLNGAARALVALYVLQERVLEAHAVMKEVQPQARPEERAGILGTRMRAEIDRIELGEAVETLGRYVAVDAGDGASRLALARAWNGLRRYDKADRVLGEWLNVRPDDPAALLTRVQMLDERNDLVGLERAVRELPEAVRDEPLVMQARGMLAESRGDLDRAEAEFRRAVEVRPEDAQAHFRLARVLRRRGPGEEAEAEQAAYQAIRAAREAVPDALNALGSVAQGAEAARGVTLRLAELCETLGWTEIAEGWRELAGRGV